MIMLWMLDNFPCGPGQHFLWLFHYVITCLPLYVIIVGLVELFQAYISKYIKTNERGLFGFFGQIEFSICRGVVGNELEVRTFMQTTVYSAHMSNKESVGILSPRCIVVKL